MTSSLELLRFNSLDYFFSQFYDSIYNSKNTSKNLFAKGFRIRNGVPSRARIAVVFFATFGFMVLHGLLFFLYT